MGDAICLAFLIAFTIASWLLYGWGEYVLRDPDRRFKQEVKMRALRIDCIRRARRS